MEEEIVNKGRQKEFDWAKAFTIIVMVVIHVYEQLSSIDTEIPPTGAFRIILEFLAGPMGAPLFMFSMGLGIMYSRGSVPSKMAHRGVLLLRNGYLLSFFKGTIPVMIGILAGATVPITIADSLFLISILQFAGMAFFAIALMKLGKFSLPAMMTTTILLSVLGEYFAQYDFTGSWLQYLLGLFFVTNKVTSFPLFRWLYYPVAGMIYAYVLQRVSDKKRFYKRAFVIGIAGTIVMSLIFIACGIDIRSMFMLAGRVFYTQGLIHYIFTTFVILAAMAVYYYLSEHVKNERIQTAVAFLGNNLDVIYIVQWLVVAYTQTIMLGALLPKLSAPLVIPVGIILLGISVFITDRWLKFKKKRAERKNG